MSNLLDLYGVKRHPYLLGGGRVTFTGVPDAPGPVTLDYDTVAWLMKADLFESLHYVQKTGQRGWVAYMDKDHVRCPLAQVVRGKLKRSVGYLDGNPLNVSRANLTSYHLGKQ
ncbi:hypothetical protein HED60_02755 [Planctomycetales bacterium ZRK34]|nr:hypothetical protein HED60_02755 [Planctomycetales bacterium ZRK34]